MTSLVVAIPTLNGSVSGSTMQAVMGLCPPPRHLRKIVRLWEKTWHGDNPEEEVELDAALSRCLEIELQETYLWPHNIVTTRSRAVHKFLRESEAEYLLFVDADVVFEPLVIRRMLDLKKDFIACPYPRRELRWQEVEKAIAEGRDPNKTSPMAIRTTKVRTALRGESCVEISGVGMGCVLMSRELLHNMYQAWGENSVYAGEQLCSNLDGVNMPQLFALQWGTTLDDGEGERCLYSEDFSFCRRAALFTKLWLYVGEGSPCKHLGDHYYEGRFE